MNEQILALHIEAESGSVLGIFLDTLTDALKMLPFLFAAFCLMELLEHHAGEKLSRFFARAGKAGPAVGAVLGCVPQCGFSVLSANLYAGGVITLGTLCAVFLSTSDEAVLLLAATPSAAPTMKPQRSSACCTEYAAAMSGATIASTFSCFSKAAAATLRNRDISDTSLTCMYSTRTPFLASSSTRVRW